MYFPSLLLYFISNFKRKASYYEDLLSLQNKSEQNNECNMSNSYQLNWQIFQNQHHVLKIEAVILSKFNYIYKAFLRFTHFSFYSVKVGLSFLLILSSYILKLAMIIFFFPSIVPFTLNSTQSSNFCLFEFDIGLFHQLGTVIFEFDYQELMTLILQHIQFCFFIPSEIQKYLPQDEIKISYDYESIQILICITLCNKQKQLQDTQPRIIKMSAQQLDSLQSNLLKNQQDKQIYQNYDNFQIGIALPQPKYTSAIQMEVQLKEPAKQQHPQQFIMPIHPELNYTAPLIPAQTYQVSQNNSLNSDTPTQYPIIQNYFKDLEFPIKSQQLLQALLLLIVHQIATFAQFYFWIVLFGGRMNSYSPFYLILYVPLYVCSLFLSNLSKFREFPFSLFLFLSNIFFTSLIYYYFISIFIDTNALAVFIYCVLICAFNTLALGIMAIYFCFEKEKIRFYILLPIFGLVYLCLLLVWLFSFPAVIVSFFYALFLLISIIQSFKGRFQLKDGQILNMANSYNYGIIVPIQILSF